MNNKKVALFINSINYVQQDSCIFSDYKIDIQELQIPFDTVIITILNKLFHLDIDLEYDKDFIVLNNFFKEILKDDFLLIEDLWFWGYFSTKNYKNKETINGKNVDLNYRKIEVNHAKYNTSSFIIPSKELLDAITNFVMEINQTPNCLK